MITRRIYVASSWRNEHQQYVVEQLREHCAAVYDFRNPPSGTGFSWTQADMCGYASTETETVHVDAYLAAMDHKVAINGYNADFAAMEWADTFVLVLPCGRSAHLELGWAAGAGKETYVLFPEAQVVPELMYRMATGFATSVENLIHGLSYPNAGPDFGIYRLTAGEVA